MINTNINYGLFLEKATDDYIAFRCCILNNLFSGFVFASQTIERILKSYMFLLKTIYNPRKSKHDLILLSKEIQSIQDCNLDKYTILFNTLNKHYNDRYPDNKDRPKSSSTEELDSIDDLVYNLLFEHIPLNDDTKYHNSFTSILFPLFLKKNYYEKKQLPKYESSFRFWFLSYNKIFQKNYTLLAQKNLNRFEGVISPYCNYELINFNKYNKPLVDVYLGLANHLKKI
jgi:hypothetical protein